MSRFQPFTFLHINDHHIGTPRSYRFRPAINRRWAAIKAQVASVDADLLLVGGDLTRDGDSHEYEYQLARDDLDTLPFPVHIIPGNQDVGNKHTNRPGPFPNRDDIALNVTSHRLQLFASYFGPLNWTFLHKGVRFTGFYAEVTGSGLREEERFWYFMDRLTKYPPARYHVAMTHYWLYINTPDEPAWNISTPEEYLNWYFSIDPPHRGRILDMLQASGVTDLFCGHVHTGRPVETTHGIRIHRTPAAGNTAQLTDRWSDSETRQGFQLCEVTEKGVVVQFVPCSDPCPEFDSYGPGGHPRLRDRDYAQAREHPPLAPDPWLMK